MRRATVADVISWEPCGFDGEDDGENYTEARLIRLAAGRKSLSILEILDLDIPAEDRIWVALHLLDEREVRLWGCDCAERALEHEREAGREPDPRSWEAIRVSMLYAVGEATSEELRLASAPARDAARDAYRGASWPTVRAAWSAWDAALGAGWDASADAALAFDRDAARAAEREWQLARLVEYARGEA